MIYVSLYIWNLLWFVLLSKTGYKNTIIFNWIGLAPLVIIIVLRGNVGIDTVAYIEMVEKIPDKNFTDFFVEPVFFLYSRFMLSFGVEPRFVVNILGTVNLVLLYFSMRQVERNGNVFALVVYPMFIFNYTMNGIREGTAVSFMVLFYHYFYQNKHIKFFFLFLLSLFSHLSMFFLAFLIKLESGKKMKEAVLGIMSILAFIFIFPNAFDYVSIKYLAYFDSETESILGIAPSALNYMMLFAIYVMSVNRKNWRFVKKTVYILIIIVGLLYLSVPYIPWFAVRLIWLCLFYTCIRTAELIQNSGGKISQIEFVLIFLIGILGLSSHIRQFLIAQPYLESPFLPYRFFWE